MFKNTLMKHKRLPRLALLPIVAISAATALPLSAVALDFTHQDWQVVCDNTDTCRLAGYQTQNNSELPVSILLTRQAGRNADVTGKVKLGGAKENSAKALMQLGNRHRISLFINNKDFGETKPFSTTLDEAELTRAQVAALLNALTQSSKIELVVRNTRWQLSDKGATAVMLKADEVQGRVGTSTAFVKTGSPKKPDSQIPNAKSVPQLRLVVPQANPDNSDRQKFSMKSSQLASIISESMTNVSEDCPNLSDGSPWQVQRLNDTQLLVQHSCWLAAYNSGDGAWVINDNKPYQPRQVTTNATGYSNGTLSSVQKGRGIGDCFSKTEWVWTGARFEKSHDSTTGLCRLLDVGGAWDLPTYVTQIQP